MKGAEDYRAASSETREDTHHDGELQEHVKYAKGVERNEPVLVLLQGHEGSRMQCTAPRQPPLASGARFFWRGALRAGGAPEPSRRHTGWHFKL